MKRRIFTAACALTLLFASALSASPAEAAGLPSVPPAIGDFLATTANFVSALFTARHAPVHAQLAAVAAGQGIITSPHIALATGNSKSASTPTGSISAPSLTVSATGTFATKAGLRAALDHLALALTKALAASRPAASVPVTAWETNTSRFVSEGASGVTLNNLTVNGVTGLTAADIPDLSANYLSTKGGTITGNLTVTGAFSGGALSLANASTTQISATAAYFGGTATSTFATDGSLTLAKALGVASGGTGWGSIAAGALLFGNGASALATSSNLFWDNTNGRLGIGTTSPTAILTLDSSSPNGTIFRVSNSSTGGHIYDWLSTGSANTGGAGRLDLFDYTSGTARFSIASNGYVGIGSTSPATILSVSGNGYFTGGVGIGVVNTQAGTLNGWAPLWGVLPSSNNAPANAGSNYAPGDLITLNGGCTVNPVIAVESVSGGGVVRYNIDVVGYCSSVPANPVPQLSTTGSGSGATFPLSWGPIAASIDEPSLTTNASGNLFIGGSLASGSLNPGEVAGGQNSGSENTYIGDRAGGRATTGSFNTAVGHNAFGSGSGIAVTGSNNVAIGDDAMRNSTSTSFDTAVGNAAMHDGGNEPLSIAIGNNALYGNANANGSNNIAIGNNAMSTTSLATAHDELFVGVNAGKNDIAGAFQVGIGGLALSNATTSSNNVAVGYNTLSTDVLGNNNVAVGDNTLSKTIGAGSTAVGFNALSISTGNDQTAFGQNAGANNTGSFNTFIGDKTAGGTGNGSNDTILGYNAANSLTNGGKNIFLGSQVASTTATGNDNIALGYDIALPSTNGSNQLDIGNLIFGTGVNGEGSNISTGYVGIGTTTPYSRLSVWGPDTASTTAFAVVNSASTTVFAVYDNGNATYSGSIFNSSDQRLKTNVSPLIASSSLAAIEALNPVSYTRLDQPEQGANLGFLAKDVQQVFPELISVTTPSALTPGGTLTLNYTGLIAPIVSAIQEIASISGDFETHLIAWLGNASNGIGDLFAHKTHQQILCIGTPSDETCITKAQLDALLAGQGIEGQADQGTAASASATPAISTPDASSTPTTASSTPDAPTTTTTGTSEQGSIAATSTDTAP